MVSLAQRRLDAAYLAAVLEIIAIIVVSAVWARLSGQAVLIVAALSASVVVGGMLWVQWRRMKRGVTSTFQPEMMPAIVAALVVTRAVSAALPATLPNVTALSLELLCALGVGGGLGFLLALPAARKAATGTARLLL
jgi:hypothetical protein